MANLIKKILYKKRVMVTKDQTFDQVLRYKL